MSSVLKDKTYAFAIRNVNLYKNLVCEQKEFVLSKQVLRSGTAVGALVSEARYAQSKKDFISKLSIALKEAHETEYWLRLLKDTQFLDVKLYDTLQVDLEEILKLLVSSVKTAKRSLEKAQ
jgi:four helix bundle protein